MLYCCVAVMLFGCVVAVLCCLCCCAGVLVWCRVALLLCYRVVVTLWCCDVWWPVRVFVRCCGVVLLLFVLGVRLC